MFQFKQFTIHQDRCAMKVGTDGVLLGAWAGNYAVTLPTPGQPEAPHSVLDIGAGTGLISLMMAQRFGQAKVTAVEIDPVAAGQCLENFEASPWAERLRIIPRSLSQAAAECEGEMYDCIVSNPPFYNATLKPEDEARAVARHKDSLHVSEIAAFARQHLSPQGQLCLIYPTAYDTEVMTACILHGLQAVRLCDVLTKVGKPCKRRMAAFQLQGHALPLLREVLSLRNSAGEYSEEYRQLTDDFYLRLL